MNIGVLGTGIVGRSHAAKLASLGHEVMIGTRDIAKTSAADRPDAMGNPPFRVWQKEQRGVHLATFAVAAAVGRAPDPVH